jgi:hypothetical protein
VGLALIMVSVNFEQLQKLRVTRLQASITSMSNVVEKQQHYHQDLLDRTHGAVQAFLTTTFGIPPTIKEDIEEKENGAFLRFASLQKFESNSALSGYDFDAADLTEAELKLVVLQILNAFDVEETLAVTPAKLEACQTAIPQCSSGCQRVASYCMFGCPGNIDCACLASVCLMLALTGRCIQRLSLPWSMLLSCLQPLYMLSTTLGFQTRNWLPCRPHWLNKVHAVLHVYLVVFKSHGLW